MSVGVRLGLMPRNSSGGIERGGSRWDDIASDLATRLGGMGLPPYLEPASIRSPYRGFRFGRAGTDHIGSSMAAGLARVAASPLLSSLAGDFQSALFLPDQTNDCCFSFDNYAGAIRVGPLDGLWRELNVVAPKLGVCLDRCGRLADADAEMICEEGEISGFEDMEDERSAWLLLFEGCRLALEERVALVVFN